jgi:hypothetical protein
MLNRQSFGTLFKVGEVINSGGPSERANAARLQILAIEDDFVRFIPLNSKTPKKFDYSYIDVVVAGFDKIDRKSIQRTIQPVLLAAGLKENVWTENYAYGFAREIRNRRGDHSAR